MKIIRGLISLYAPSYAAAIVYMLQSTEYKVGPYLKWYWRTEDFSRVMHRRVLDKTRPAQLLMTALLAGMLAEVLAGIWLIYQGSHDLVGGTAFGLALIFAYPIFWAHLIILPLLFGRWFMTGPKERRLVAQSEEQFARHSAAKVAVVGSYGKTTMKEILTTVLSEGKKVAATPANKNVSISHANFIRGLNGDEDVLIIEYGEGRPGDVKRFSRTTHPTHAVITGLAPAHLDQYKTLSAAGHDIFSVTGYVEAKNVFVNGESAETKPFVKDDYQIYSRSGALGWAVHNIKADVDGISFSIKKGRESIALSSSLIGRHQVGVLTLAAALALELGLTKEQVKSGVQKTASFEHRMQPYRLGGAWIIDDTYNGNIEGVRAGTELLKELPASRKIYVTPGLVDQGEETDRVHLETGHLIANAKPDIAVLMKNSVTKYIEQGLNQAGFKGQLRIEEDPLEFYTNLEHFVAAGDLVLMQNDWTDNYY